MDFRTNKTVNVYYIQIRYAVYCEINELLVEKEGKYNYTVLRLWVTTSAVGHALKSRAGVILMWPISRIFLHWYAQKGACDI